MLQREEMKLQKCKLHTETSDVEEYRNYYKKGEKTCSLDIYWVIDGKFGNSITNQWKRTVKCYKVTKSIWHKQ